VATSLATSPPWSAHHPQPPQSRYPYEIANSENHDRSAYRAVYTAKFGDVVYVLHVFQKKSKSGIATPQHEINIIRERLKYADEHYMTMHQ